MSKPKPTKKQFIEWLRAQAPERSFEFTEPCGCLIAGFLHENGHPDARVGSRSYSVGRLDSADFHDHFFPAWMQRVSDVSSARCRCVFTVKEFAQEYFK